MQGAIAHAAAAAAGDMIERVKSAETGNRECDRLVRMIRRAGISGHCGGTLAECGEGGIRALRAAAGDDHAPRSGRKDRLGGRKAEAGRATDDDDHFSIQRVSSHAWNSSRIRRRLNHYLIDTS